MDWFRENDRTGTCITENTMIPAKKGKWSCECSMDEDKRYLRQRSEFWKANETSHLLLVFAKEWQQI